MWSDYCFILLFMYKIYFDSCSNTIQGDIYNSKVDGVTYSFYFIAKSGIVI